MTVDLATVVKWIMKIARQCIISNVVNLHKEVLLIAFNVSDLHNKLLQTAFVRSTYVQKQWKFSTNHMDVNLICDIMTSFDLISIGYYHAITSV